MRLVLCQIGDACLKEEAGELGLQGLQGQKGEPGMMGTDVLPGPTGEAGLIGEPGPEGAPADNEQKGAKIQPGPSGDQGPQGDDGDQGAQGECADLGCGWGGEWACGVLHPMVQVVHLPWTNRTPFTYLLKSELCIPFNYCKCTVFYNLNRSQNQKLSLTSKQFICYPF